MGPAVPSAVRRASAGDLRGEFEWRGGGGGDVGEFGVELLVDGGCGLSGRLDGDGAVFDLKVVGGEGAEHVVAVGRGRGRCDGGLVLADEGEFGRVDDEVEDVELLAVPGCLDVDGVDGAADAGGGVDEACGERVDVFGLEVSAEGSEGGVMRVDGAGVAVERDGAVAGEVGRGGEGEGFLEGEVFGVEGELVVGAARRRGRAGSGRGADGQLTVADGDVADGEVRDEGAGFFVGGGVLLGAAYGGVVPGAVGGTEKIDFGRVDGEAGDVDLAAEDEGDHLDADFDLGGLEEGLGAEGGIVGDGCVLGDEVAGEDGEVEFAEGDLAAERGGEGRFDAGAEGVGVEEERDRKGDEQDEGDDTAEDDQEGAAGKGHRTSLGLSRTCKLVVD